MPLIKRFFGINVEDENRNSLELELANNVGVDDGELFVINHQNERINSTAFTSGITGGYNYRPKGAAAGDIIVTSDGNIAKA